MLKKTHNATDDLSQELALEELILILFSRKLLGNYSFKQKNIRATSYTLIKFLFLIRTTRPKSLIINS